MALCIISKYFQIKELIFNWLMKMNIKFKHIYDNKYFIAYQRNLLWQLILNKNYYSMKELN